MGDRKDQMPAARPDSSSSVEAFLSRARAVPATRSDRGRLVFALDATMSRQPTWDLAQGLQGRMFEQAASFGGLDVQLAFFRGFGECKTSRFVSGGQGLAALMAKIVCRGGRTQIGKVLRHVLEEHGRARIGALVYVGDAMEESVDELSEAAGELGLRGVKAFLFQEGRDGRATTAFREMARLTGGAHAAFDAGAPDRLAALLGAAAAYAAGGQVGLEAVARDNDAAARLLLSQMRR